MAIYKVGMGSDTALVEAESAEAAALFYGKDVGRGNAVVMAVVYEVDGQPYEGDRMPWSKYFFDTGDAVFAEFEERLHQYAEQICACQYVESEGDDG